MALTETPRASPDALLTLANREGRGRLKIFLGAAPGVGKTYAMLQAARTARDGGRGRGHRPRRDPRTPGNGGAARKASRSCPVSQFPIAAGWCRSSISTPRSRASLSSSSSMNTPTPTRRQPPSETMAGYRGAAGGRDRRLDDAERPASRKPQRRHPAHHAGAGARDRARYGLRQGRRVRPCRPAAGRAAQATGRGQSLCPGHGGARRRQFLSCQQSRGVAGTGAAPCRRAHRQRPARADAGRRRSRGRGPRANASLSASARTRSPRWWSAHAKRLADAIGAPWLAVTVERPGRALARRTARSASTRRSSSPNGSAPTRRRRCLRDDMVQELLRFARFENVTQIVVGRSRGGWWSELFGRSLPHQLVHHADDIAIHVVTAKDGQPGRRAGGTALRRMRPAPSLAALPRGRLSPSRERSSSGAAMASVVSLPNVSMIFLMAVLFAAVRFGIWPAVFSLVPVVPRLQFLLHRAGLHLHGRAPARVAGAVHLPWRAVLTSALAGRAREQARAAVAGRGRRGGSTSSPASCRLSPMRTRSPRAAADRDQRLSRPPVAILLPQGDDLELAAAWPPEDRARHGLGLGRALGLRARTSPPAPTPDTLPNVPLAFLPLRTSARPRRGDRRRDETSGRL